MNNRQITELREGIDKLILIATETLNSIAPAGLPEQSEVKAPASRQCSDICSLIQPSPPAAAIGSPATAIGPPAAEENKDEAKELRVLMEERAFHVALQNLDNCLNKSAVKLVNIVVVVVDFAKPISKKIKLLMRKEGFRVALDYSLNQKKFNSSMIHAIIDAIEEAMK